MWYKKIVIFLLTFFICPLFCLAEEKIELKCNNSVKSIICDISGFSSDYEIVAIEAKIVTTDNLKLIEYKNDSLWIGDASDNLISIYGIGASPNVNFNIGSLKFNVIDDNLDFGNVNLEQVRFADSNYKWHYLNDASSEFDVEYFDVPDNNSWQIILIILATFIILIILIALIIFCFKKIKEDNNYFKVNLRTKIIIIFVILLVIFIGLLILLIYTISSNKENGYLSYGCNKYKTNEVRCELFGYSNFNVNAIEASIDDYLFKDVEFKMFSNWQGDYTNGQFMLVNSENIKNKFKIGDLFIDSSKIQNKKVKIKNIKFVDSIGKEYKVDDLTIKIEE